MRERERDRRERETVCVCVFIFEIVTNGWSRSLLRVY
jgi:hypothetical protein